MNNAVYKALVDPTRRQILKLLGGSRGAEMTAGEIGEHFQISGPSMSHHFNLLKEADLIAARREGQHIYYSLNTTVVQDLLAGLMDLLGPGAADDKKADDKKRGPTRAKSQEKRT